MDSKSLPPRTESFFPTIFYKTQFCERQAGLPPGLNLASKVALVTGSNAGLGFESARQLLGLHLSHLILAVRSIDKGEAAAKKLRDQYPRAKIEVWKLDMCSYASIQEFAKRVETELTRLDIALLNAGLVKPSFTLVKETGHEETMQVVCIRCHDRPGMGAGTNTNLPRIELPVNRATRVAADTQLARQTSPR
jgi:NAD(P)-dependent dehydrogenase (short-subunit alcohol dehydrogenase family)